MYKNTFFDYDGSTYYVDFSGVMATGWKKINGYWYYFHDWVGMYKSTFFDYDEETYYVDASGEMAVGWNTINGATYCFQSWGGAYRGWNELTRSNYYKNALYWNYFSNSGKLIVDSDAKGCSHGKSTFSDYHIKTGTPITYYPMLDSVQNSVIEDAASKWGSQYFVKADSPADVKLNFEYSERLDASITGQTLYVINDDRKIEPISNYERAVIVINEHQRPVTTSTIAHEMGHVLGLSHRITNQACIM